MTQYTLNPQDKSTESTNPLTYPIINKCQNLIFSQKLFCGGLQPWCIRNWYISTGKLLKPKNITEKEGLNPLINP